MQQFFRCKDQYPDAILFFRLGDFYEMFFEDAVVASQLLGITLTSRSKTAEGEKIPMAGVPHHAAAGYVAKLLGKGQKVAICEQMADPSQVKGVVPREVVRVVTPGLCLEPDALDARLHNYLAVVTRGENSDYGLAAFELSTNELRAAGLADGASLLAELVRLDPREVIVPAGPTAQDAQDAQDAQGASDAAPDAAAQALRDDLARALPNAVVREARPVETAADPEELLAEALAAGDESLRGVVGSAGLRAAAEALRYARSTQPGVTLEVRRLGVYDPQSQLVLDEAAVKNLELARTLGGERRGSLLHQVDATRSAMGARLLRRRLLAPLTDVAAIRRRHDLVEAFVLDPALRDDLREGLSGVGDLERLATRAELGVATPRDLGAIRNGLEAAAVITGLLEGRAKGAAGFADPLAQAAPADPCADVLRALAGALVDEPPVVPHQGGIFRAGLDPALDELRDLSASSKDVVLALEQREKVALGVNLKIRFTRVFGYYIEITKANLLSLGAVPEHYRRKQTVANAERFVTPELDELQGKILNADERSRAIEKERFAVLRKEVAAEAPRLRTLGARLADLDVHASFADGAHRYGYVRPEVDDTLSLDLVEARHPIVERLAAAGEFVPNDVRLDVDDARLMIITGPNMSGKSTAMRQVALAVILAQAGGFVPAKSARIGVVDRIYTRVGASDNLGRGQSTFMVEMIETAAILRGATRRSLVILDEIGRGTSTYDGLAIAWAVAEHLHDVIACRAMFATHYHELCELAETRATVLNTNVAASEYDGEVVFLHKLVPGSANRSYGVAVARLAGVPEIVLARARRILGDLEDGAPLPSGASPRSPGAPQALGGAAPQLDLFSAPAPRESEVEATLKNIDVDQLKPVDALVALARLKDLLES
ncbi:MAG: DNA mismatch repair protein MutS [Deltaproteobacteria bacterium]|nr:MAG: DNA mismatch repair protein MutS [Deltaproteobacteria bacterium]